MGKRYPYMVHTMTDETYAANCALQMQQEQRAKESDQKMGQNEKKAVPEEDEKNIAKSRENIRKRDEMFWIALFSRISWLQESAYCYMSGRRIHCLALSEARHFI